MTQEKEDAVAEAKAEAAATVEKEKRENLLLVSRFLRLAAQRRADETADPNLDENMALEALLFLFYDGEERAVESMLKYIQGSDEKVVSIHGENLSTTCEYIQYAYHTFFWPGLDAQIKAASGAYAPPAAIVEADPAQLQATELGDFSVQTDPTMVNAGLTELDDAPMTNGQTNEVTASTGVPQTEIGGDGNAVAEASWDNTANDLSASQEWVNVTPRDATETDTGVTTTVSAPAQNQSWADEQPDTPPATEVSFSPSTLTPSLLITSANIVPSLPQLLKMALSKSTEPVDHVTAISEVAAVVEDSGEREVAIEEVVVVVAEEREVVVEATSVDIDRIHNHPSNLPMRLSLKIKFLSTHSLGSSMCLFPGSLATTTIGWTLKRHVKCTMCHFGRAWKRSSQKRWCLSGSCCLMLTSSMSRASHL